MSEMWLLTLLTIDATLRVSAPLILAAMAGLFSERSGVIDIGLEGKMLAGAFAAAATAAVTGSAWLGLGAAVLVSVALAMLHGFACITHKGDQVVSGVALNVLVAGLTIVLGIAWFDQGGQTPPLASDARFQSHHMPEVGFLRGIPILGSIWYEVIAGHNILVYVALLSVPFTWWVVYRTRFGLRLRAVGESPAAVDTAGIQVEWLRYRALIITGILCGIAGAYLSTGQSAGFVRDMTAGKGYIALAAMIFGKWRPVPALLACLLFGFLDAVAVRLQGVDIPGIGEAPVALIQALPYALTVILLAGFIGKAIAPKAIGRAYVKER